jgi:hypothetical protein
VPRLISIGGGGALQQRDLPTLPVDVLVRRLTAGQSLCAALVGQAPPEAAQDQGSTSDDISSTVGGGLDPNGRATATAAAATAAAAAAPGSAVVAGSAPAVLQARLLYERWLVDAARGVLLVRAQATTLPPPTT